MQVSDLIGKRVVVRSRTGAREYQDEGVLQALTPQWVIIQNDDKELLLFPAVSVRLVKVLAKPERSVW